MPDNPIYQRFIAFAQEFSAAHPVTAVDGDYYELPGIVVYHTATLPLAAKGRIEVNTTTPAATQQFEWMVEVTINDKIGERFIHFIVRRAGDVVETYGKTVLPVSAGRADEIFSLLEQLQSVT